MRVGIILLIFGVANAIFVVGAKASEERYVDLGNYSKQTYYFHESAWTVRSDLIRKCEEGDCVNWIGQHRPLHFQCSADTRSGLIEACYWVFVAMHLELDPQTGAIHGTTTTSECNLPLPKNLGAVELANALLDLDPLNVPLPGIHRSLWSMSKECLPGRFA